MKFSYFSLIAVALLVACSESERASETSAAKPTEPAPPAQIQDKGTLPSNWDDSESPVMGTSISVSPNPVDFCASKTASVQISWDLAAAKPKNPQIWVRNSQGQKLWTAFKNLEGSKGTGKWVKEGIQFIAIDSTTRKVINSVSVQAANCK